MSNERMETTPAENFQNDRKADKNQKNKPLTRAERAEQKLARQIDLVQNKNYVAVPRRALETNAAIALIAKNDYLVDRLRDRLVSDPTINIDEAIAALKQNQKIRQELNELNQKICSLMGMEYEAPRGFEISPSPADDGKKEDKAAKAA